ncbi:MAG: hypothetical protein AAF604_16945 [Acidobacteriota bacterium]
MKIRYFVPIVALSGLLACAPPSDDQATAPADTPEPPSAAAEGSAPPVLPDANRIAWSTASEVDNFGYDIYRSESPDGPFERITEQPLEGAGTTDLPSSYEFIDDTIELGKDYFYYIESISMSGERRRFTGVRRAPAK